jgi:hypothetical protein
MSNIYQIGQGQTGSQLRPTVGRTPQPRAQSRAQGLAGVRTRIEESVARSAMKQIEQLDENWDGYGALAIRKSVRINAWAALNTFLEVGLVPDVSPNASGTISLEWHVDGTTSHLQVGRTRFSMYIDQEDVDTQYFEGDVRQIPPVAISALIKATAPAASARITHSDFDYKRGFASN